MTQIYITIAIIAVIAVLVCYVFIQQTIKERKKAKQRLQRVLDKRAKELVQMLGIFPNNFLPQELRVFIYRCIIDAYEQLTQLSPKDHQYIEGFKLYSSQMETVIRQPEKQVATNIESTAQINEIKQNLNLLSTFLKKWHERNNINAKQFSHYRGLLKDLVIMLTIDNYKISAKQAAQIGKPKLAIHYYELAQKLLTKETPANYQKQIEIITTAITPLIEQVETEEKASGGTQDATAHANTNEANPSQEDDSEWSQFEEDSSWKKKNVYD